MKNSVIGLPFLLCQLFAVPVFAFLPYYLPWESAIRQHSHLY